MSSKSCCMPSSAAGPSSSAGARVARAEGADALTPSWIELQGGRFRMGSDSDEGYAGDGEGPSRDVFLSPFAIAATTVTNAEFSRFVRATQHITDAEQAGVSHDF